MQLAPTRLRRLSAAFLVGALATVPIVTPVPAEAATVDARTGTLITHPSGLPAAGAASARQVVRAKVTQDLVHDRMKATITLGGVPTAATNAQVHVEFGNVVDNSCHGDVGVTSATHTGLSSGFTRSGRTITLNKQVDEAGYMDWDCAFVATSAPGTDTTYDAVVGSLKDVLAKPKLKISAVQLLRKNVKRIKLVPKVWTVLEVRVRNPSRVDATRVTVKGRGKALRVKKVKLGRVHDDGSALARVRVKLSRKTASTLKLTVAGSGGAKAVRKVRVAWSKAPTRPAAGRYKSQNGRLSFRIKKGRVVGFWTQQWTTCGGYPDPLTTSWAAYDFPRTAVPRNGIVDARQKHRLFTAGLQMKVAGKKATKGYFFYSGPSRCFASEKFTARRVGR